MNKKRPVNLDISTIKLPVTAYASILHRMSGILLFAGMAFLLWMLDSSLDSQESFAAVRDVSSNPICKFVLFVGVSRFGLSHGNGCSSSHYGLWSG
ncbi:MAG: succinate dehydrogenase, cytochrome b556 subunit [Marinagarivorans sp.]|nr:succinate dehydrogenase, cytochrome b556 subunit [Marinagarivorans sp.]